MDPNKQVQPTQIETSAQLESFPKKNNNFKKIFWMFFISSLLIAVAAGGLFFGEKQSQHEKIATVATQLTPASTSMIKKCTDGTLYGQCSDSKPKYCDDGNLIDKVSLCGCQPSYKISDNQCVVNTQKVEYKIGIVYVSESADTYNANWQTDIYPNKSKIENALNDMFSKKSKKFIVDFLGEYRANNLCWNPNKVAFILEFIDYPGSIEEGTRVTIPGGYLCQGDTCDYTCIDKNKTVLWSDVMSQSRYEEYSNPDFPNSQCFRAKCENKYFTLSLQNINWIVPFLNELQSSISFSNYDYKVIVLGKAGPIIPDIGGREKDYFDTVMTTGDIMGYYAPSSKVIVMTENGLRLPSFYSAKNGNKIFMPGWQQIVHEILHQFGAVDVYEPALFQQNTSREEALKLEPKSEVDKSIMANSWAGYCNDYWSAYSCTAQDTEKIYLDKFNRAKLGLE